MTSPTIKSTHQFMNYLITGLCFSFALAVGIAWSPLALSETDLHETQAHEDEPGLDQHASHDESEHGHEEDEHDHEEEGGSSVGPDKGIIDATENKGIRLAPQAIQNFGIRTVPLKGGAPWKVPTSATLHALEEVNLYRLRGGFFKRVDFNVVKRAAENMTVASRDLKSGDEIVVDGVGFLRIAELTAFGGAPEGHSH